MVSDNDIELTCDVLIEEHEPYGVLKDDFVKPFSQFADWKCLFKNYGPTAPINAAYFL